MDKWTFEVRELPHGGFVGLINGEQVCAGMSREGTAKSIVRAWREKIDNDADADDDNDILVTEDVPK